MSQIPGGPRPQVSVPASSNVYTVLMAVAVLALLTAVAVVGYANMQVTGGNPLAVAEAKP